MKNLFIYCTSLLMMTLGFGISSYATPMLQLDIIGGHYNLLGGADGSEDTTVTNDSNFTLLALLTGHGQTDPVLEDYYVSLAITPLTSESLSFDAGSFDLGLNTYHVNDTTMMYGTPADGTFAPHGIYDSYFMEFLFDFDPADTTTTYNAEDDAGGVLFDESGSGSFFKKFNFDVSGLSSSYEVHFDLYSKEEDGSVYRFAPLSHDAEYKRVPEPVTIALLGLGLVSFGVIRRRRQS